MPKLLFLLAGFLLQGAVKRLLLGAGLGLLSMAFIQAIFNAFIHFATNSMYGAGGIYEAMQLVSIARLDEGLSIVLGAVTARVTINAMTVALTR